MQGRLFEEARLIDDEHRIICGEVFYNILSHYHRGRYEKRSTIVTSQVPVDHWCDMIGNPTLARAILDRLVHNACRIELSGELAKAASDTSKRLTARRRLLDFSTTDRETRRLLGHDL